MTVTIETRRSGERNGQFFLSWRRSFGGLLTFGWELIECTVLASLSDEGFGRREKKRLK